MYEHPRKGTRRDGLQVLFSSYRSADDVTTVYICRLFVFCILHYLHTQQPAPHTILAGVRPDV